MNYKKDFPMLNNDLIYFDNGATTFKPQVVIDKVKEYYETKTANIERGEYDLSYNLYLEVEAVRNKVKNFINSKLKEEIIFTKNTTESINLIVFGYFKNVLTEGDEIILTKSEHASNLLPWFKLAKDLNLKIKYLELDDNHQVTVEELQKVITLKTKVISLAHVSNTISDIRPLKEIVKLAKEHNILVVGDGAQAISHLPVDVKDLDIDFYCFSGHKMYGPTGIGILYGKYELLNNLNPLILGGGMNSYFDEEGNYELQPLPEKLEGGTLPLASILGLGSSIDYLNEIKMSNVFAYEKELRNYLITKLKAISHLKIYNENSEGPAVIFNVDGIFSQDVAIYLNKYKVCLRSGNHCVKLLDKVIGVSNVCRLSLGIYNTKEEIDYVVNLLSDYEKIKKEMI